ncbi:MAG: winged helix-turn-helix transcriptional regulator [Anaerolineae bacterium]|nr:winged helix-turn-helix transcriptional regulator [Anaerolineae bacterium]
MNSQLLVEIDLLHAEICDALADPKRIAILYALREGTATVNQLSELVDLPQAATSRHLKVLRERRLVRGRRAGMNVHYTLNNPKVTEALDLLRQVVNENLVYDAKLAQALGA